VLLLLYLLGVDGRQGSGGSPGAGEGEMGRKRVENRIWGIKANTTAM